MTGDPRAALVAARTASIAAADGVRLPESLALWRLAGPPMGASPRGGHPDELGELLEASTPADQRAQQGQHFTPRAMAEELVARAWSATDRPTVGDPACGGGALLLAAARHLEAQGLDRVAVLDHLWGADLDPLAVATTEATLTLWAGTPPPAGHLVVADTLVDDLGWPALDVVVGNPPFLGQLAAATTVTRARAATLRRRYGEAVQAYTDPAGLFLLRAVELAAPGGRVAMVLPQSIVGTRDAAGVRDAVGRTAELLDLWVPVDRFEAGIDVCLAVLAVGGGGAVGSWSAALARLLGVPAVDLGDDRIVGDRATVAASFRQEYYGLLPGLAERHDEPGGHPVITTGRIDLGGLRDRAVRLGRRSWADPVVVPALADEIGRRWIERTLVPKVLVATQTKVIEAAVDRTGELVPVTPVISILAPVDELWRLAAAVAAPPVSAWAFARVAGTALSAGALRLTAPLVRSIPLPVDDVAWTTGTDAFRAGDLERFGAAMVAAYGASPAVLDWWRPRAEPVWSRRE